MAIEDYDQELNELAGRIASSNCALFAGAGLSINAGGPSWDELTEKAKSEFDYNSPLDENFQIFSDLKREVGGTELHQFVQRELSGIELGEDVEPLASLPWFSTFTTNFDTALEDALSKYHRSVRTVHEGREFILSGDPSDLYCVKLMGSIEKNYGDSGSMVLTSGEKSTAQDKRSHIFRELGNHAANLSFLFVGYSFRDRIFTEILEKIINEAGELERTYYALFRSPLDEEQEYYLNSLNVVPIIADIEDFTEELVKRVSQRDTSDHRMKNIPFGSQMLELSLDDIGDFVESYDPILLDELQREGDAQNFFKGEITTFRPFTEDWHFTRSEESEIISKLRNQEPDIVSVSGSPGSGRTFLINSTIEALIRDEGGIAIRIPSHKIDPIPSHGELDQFLEFITDRCEELGIPAPEFCVFFSTSGLETNQLMNFNRLKSRSDFHLQLLMESPQGYSFPSDMEEEKKCDNIEIQDEIPRPIRQEFKTYVVDTVRKHRLPAISEQEVQSILNDDPEFLPVMYRAIDPARRSIQDIIEQEYEGLTDEAKRIVKFSALATSVDLEMPIAVCRRAMTHQSGEFYSFPEIINIAENEANEFIKISRDARTNQLLAIYHPIVAKHICKKIGEKEMGEYLLDIAESVDLQSGIEGEFVGRLMISKGVNREATEFLPITKDYLKESMDIVTSRQPARPLLHHKAILMQEMGEDSSKVISTMEEAIAEPPEEYVLTERKENVLTSLARIKWKINRDELENADRYSEDIMEIFAYLEDARRSVLNLHTYDLQSNILMSMAEGREEKERNSLLNEAINLIERAMEMDGEAEDIRTLEQTRVELYDRIEREQAEELAEKLVEQDNDGSGYYTLARLDLYENSDPAAALRQLTRAMSAEEYPPEAIAFRIKLLMQQDDPFYDLVAELAKDLDLRDDFEDSWESAYHKAIAYLIDGNYQKAYSHFETSHSSAPWNLHDTVDVFWKDDGQKKTFTGKIGNPLTDTEGWIYSHGLEGWDDDIYFDPSLEDSAGGIRSGRNVEFTLGFTPRGPKARDIQII
ncbi:SIR2 family protein [Haloarcula pellucida]|uniref:SIR2-like domain-containing protein n=1 Tax=Haloarcula pellucida TaxID=1427151 RepID=A0A830GP77_9EURY|nr:SIR2 family protein [Halomicroarcula pellucida]MBX0347991.1 SIR2 family protein [Halomicroarcula pellucida]GGN96400.1 hypothetical protein GCM10009030_24640 [Halomicroarcula pellucida]